MNYLELSKIAGLFDTLAGQCQARIGGDSCSNKGTVFIGDLKYLGWYCDDHADYCEFCNRALLKTEENMPYGGQLLHPECADKMSCPNCGNIVSSEDELLEKDYEEVVGCEKCMAKCYNCSGIVPQDEVQEDPDGDPWCDECFNDTFYSCENCGKTDHRDDALVTEHGEIGCSDCFATCAECGDAHDKNVMTKSEGDIWCDDCFNEKFFHCENCGYVKENDEMNSTDWGIYCDECFNESYARCQECDRVVDRADAYVDADNDATCHDCLPENEEVSEEHWKYTENINSFSFHSQSRNVRALRRIVPISIKELRKKYPKLATSAKDIIVFSKGKELTSEMLDDYEAGQSSFNYRIEYSGWDYQQRSVESRDVNQLVLSVIAPWPIVRALHSDPGSRAGGLFDLINDSGRMAGHPWADNQIGWARLELDEENKIILVDEIQSDHMNALGRIARHRYSGYNTYMKDKWKLSNDEINVVVKKLKGMIKSFPDLMTEAISAFAKANGFKKLYWHTYESGRKLKGAGTPPKSLYTTVPKRNYFKPTDERPFDLEGEFLTRLARKMRLRMLKKLG